MFVDPCKIWKRKSCNPMLLNTTEQILSSMEKCGKTEEMSEEIYVWQEMPLPDC